MSTVTFDPRFIELAPLVLSGLATPEQVAEFKALKAAAKESVKSTDVSGMIALREKAIAKLQGEIEFIKVNGIAPPVAKRNRKSANAEVAD